MRRTVAVDHRCSVKCTFHHISNGSGSIWCTYEHTACFTAVQIDVFLSFTFSFAWVLILLMCFLSVNVFVGWWLNKCVLKIKKTELKDLIFESNKCTVSIKSLLLLRQVMTCCEDRKLGGWLVNNCVASARINTYVVHIVLMKLFSSQLSALKLNSFRNWTQWRLLNLNWAHLFSGVPQGVQFVPLQFLPRCSFVGFEMFSSFILLIQTSDTGRILFWELHMFITNVSPVCSCLELVSWS